MVYFRSPASFTSSVPESTFTSKDYADWKQAMAETVANPPTGYMFSELMMWHNPGSLQSIEQRLEPTRHWEDVGTKRRLHNLLVVSGLQEQLQPVKPRAASIEELCRVHERTYVERVRDLSADTSKGHHSVGDEATFGPGGFDLAALASGGAIEAVDAVMFGRVVNAYALIRPPGTEVLAPHAWVALCCRMHVVPYRHQCMRVYSWICMH